MGKKIGFCFINSGFGRFLEFLYIRMTDLFDSQDARFSIKLSIEGFNNLLGSFHIFFCDKEEHFSAYSFACIYHIQMVVRLA